MHKSRLAAIVIDCQTTDVDGAAAFWSAAFGWPARALVGDGSPDGPALLRRAPAAARLRCGRAHVELLNLGQAKGSAPMIRMLAIVSIAAALGGCGWFERKVTANITGHAVACVDGVAYLQFPSGVTVQYDRSGRIKTC